MPMLRLQLLGPVAFTAGDGRDLRPIQSQPKRFAVLAYLACQAPDNVRRDSLLPLFWPELDQSSARKALRQTLWTLRNHVGGDTIEAIGDEQIRLVPTGVWCDVTEFRRQLGEGKIAEALELYRGELLAGFFFAGAPNDFERWLEEERYELRTAAVRSAWTLAESSERDGDAAAAAMWGRRAAHLADDETALQRLVKLLDRLGNRAGALRAYEAFARRFKDEFDEAPSPETQELVAALKSRKTTEAAAAASGDAGAARVPVVPQSAPNESSRALRRGNRWILSAGVLAVTAAVIAVASQREETAVPQVVAVGDITLGDTAVALSFQASRTLPELLSTDFARLQGLRVVSHARLQELRAELRDSTRPAPSSVTLARTAGATDLLEGTIYQLDARQFRLDLRRVEIRNGTVREAVTVTAPDPFALADSAVRHFARSWRAPAPATSLAEETSTSLEARTLYNEGLEHYYRATDYEGAAALFRAALRRDSLYAMAAYYLHRSLAAVGDSTSWQWLERAQLRQARATDRERRIIAVAWAVATQSPSLLPQAETLAARYPGEPQTDIQLAIAYDWASEHQKIVPLLRPIVRTSLLRVGGSAEHCPACDAAPILINALLTVDSIKEAEQVARAWTAFAPRSPQPWEALFHTLSRARRDSEALAAVDSMSARDAMSAVTKAPLYHALALLRRAEVDSACAITRALSTVPQTNEDGLWYTIICLRNAGRLKEALSIATRSTAKLGFLPVGQILFEQGRYAEAAATFDSLAATHKERYPGWRARWLSWHQTHVATALAAQGDTTRLERLADSIEKLGNQTAWRRNRYLAGYVRGLLLQARGRDNEAEDSLRSGIYAGAYGYTRVHLALARTLLRLGRAREAVPYLQQALAGSEQGSNYYTSWAEEHELLAQAFAAAGQPDSARAHYAWIARAWSRADPEFHPRVLAAERYIRANRKER